MSLVQLEALFEVFFNFQSSEDLDRWFTENW
jgi:hypothetical protein